MRLTFAGVSYPSSDGAEPSPQHFNLKLLCDPEGDASSVNFTSYDGKDLWLEWKAPAGCALGVPPNDDTKEPDGGGDSGSGDDKKEEAVGSGLGYFFLL